MKIAVTSTGRTMDSKMDSRFGRCSFFVLIDTNDMAFEAIENSSGSLGGGAGIQSARLMAEKGVRAVLTGAVGPNAHETLSAAGIEVFTGLSGTISDVVARYKTEKLIPVTEPDAKSHAGMKGGR